jgi:hypothetical protein
MRIAQQFTAGERGTFRFRVPEGRLKGLSCGVFQSSLRDLSEYKVIGPQR